MITTTRNRNCLKTQKAKTQRNKRYTRDTYCVEARVLPSALKATAIVDLGGGPIGQYFPDKCFNDSASTLHFHGKHQLQWESQRKFKTRTFTFAIKRTQNTEKYHEIILCPTSFIVSLLLPHEESLYHLLWPHRFLGTNLAFGDVSLWTSKLKILLPLNNKFKIWEI